MRGRLDKRVNGFEQRGDPIWRGGSPLATWRGPPATSPQKRRSVLEADEQVNRRSAHHHPPEHFGVESEVEQHHAPEKRGPESPSPTQTTE